MGKKTTKHKTSNKKRISMTIGQALDMPEDAFETLTDWWKIRIRNFRLKHAESFGPRKRDNPKTPDSPHKIYYYVNDRPVMRVDIDKLKNK